MRTLSVRNLLNLSGQVTHRAFCLSLCCSLFATIDRDLRADEVAQEQLVNSSLNANLQSVVELPEDFIVRVEDGRLRVVIESIGAMGQRSARSNLDVSLFDEDGVAQSATTNSSGIAEFKNVRVDALHAILVNDESFHAAVPVLTMSPSKAQEKNVVASSVRFAPILADRDVILTSVANSGSLNVGVGALLGVEDFRPAIFTEHRVQLAADGTLNGRIVVADRDLNGSQRYANVTIFQDRQPIARTTANAEDGSFALPNLAPGVYGVIASGPAGYTAFEFEVIPAGVDFAMPKDPNNLPVSFTAQANSQLVVFLVPPKLMVGVRDSITNAYGNGATPSNMASGPMVGFPGASGMGGGMGGGGSGGSGMSGGGLGAGGALAVAGIVAAIATSESNSSPNNNQPPVVSPIAP